MRNRIPSWWRAVLVPGLCGGLLVAVAQLTDAAEDAYDPSEVLAYRGEVVLTQREIDAAFSGIPEEFRLAFIRDGAKVDQLILSLLDRKTLAAEAERAAFDQDPLVAARLRLAMEKELAEAWLQQVVAEAPAADYESLAREDFLAHPERYRSEEVLDVSHILIGLEGLGDQQARVRAQSLLKILETDPARFDELVLRYSDDPGKEENAGRYPEMRRGQMDAPFEQAAYDLQPGEISKPVRTRHGWHIIRLNGRTGGELAEFEEVREMAMERQRQEHLANYRATYLLKLREQPVIIPEGAVEIMAKRHFGEDLGMAPGPASNPSQ